MRAARTQADAWLVMEGQCLLRYRQAQILLDLAPFAGFDTRFLGAAMPGAAKQGGGCFTGQGNV